MRKTLSVIFAIIIWFSVIAQFYLMLENRVASIPETVIRFLSFFTILTNTLAALYFTQSLFKVAPLRQPGVLTALTVYITIVGLVYQIILRNIWQPEGLQRLVDELLHSINPLLVIIYWAAYEAKSRVRYGQLWIWLLYPLVYFIYILLRGAAAGFYPYPFVNVNEIGWPKALMNGVYLLVAFAVVSFLFIFMGKQLSNRKMSDLTDN